MPEFCNSSGYDKGYYGHLWGSSFHDVKVKLNTQPSVTSIDTTNFRIKAVRSDSDCDLDEFYSFDEQYGLKFVKIFYCNLVSFEELEQLIKSILGEPQEEDTRDILFGQLILDGKVRKWYNYSIELILYEDNPRNSMELKSQIIDAKVKIRDANENLLEEKERIQRKKVAKDSLLKSFD